MVDTPEIRLRLPVCLINYSWFAKYSAALCACIKWRSTRVNFSASIIECHSNPLTVYCQFYVLGERAWISRLCNGTYRSRVMALYSYLTAARSSWDWERHGSHAVPTGQEGKVRDSNLRTDEVFTIRDGLPRCCGVAEANNDAENYSCNFALADIHSCG